MPTIREGIYSLLRAVEIDTTEEGRRHVEPWMSQRMVIDTVADMLEKNHGKAGLRYVDRFDKTLPW